MKADRIALLATVTVLALRGCFAIPEKEEELAPPVLDAPSVSYDVEKMGRRNFARFIAVTGRLAPSVKKDLFFRYQGGRLTDLRVSLGDSVNKGDVLAELNVGTMAGQIKLREIAVSKAKVRQEMLKATNANRFELQMADLDVQTAEIQLQELRDQFTAMRLVAPIAGLVSTVDAKEGDVVDPFRVILRLVDPKRLVFLCTGEQTRKFSVGMKVDVQFRGADYGGSVLMTPLDYIEETQAKPAEIMVVEVPRLPADAKMNESGIVSVTLEKSLDTFVLRKEVLHQYGGKTYVNVLVNGLKEEREVQTGIQTESEVEIVKGLRENDLVVTR